MIIHSIRLRLQLWLVFLLAMILSGFGFTAYRLQHNSRLDQIDEELERRVIAVNKEVRGPAPFSFPDSKSKPPDESRGPGGPGGPGGLGGRGGGPGGPGGFGQRDGPMGPPSDLMDSEFGGRGGPQRNAGGPGNRVVQLSAATASLFGTSTTNDFYFAAWTRRGSLMAKSTNAPAELGVPERYQDSAIHERTLGDRREAVQFTEMGDCVLVGRYISTDLEALDQFAWWLFAAGAGILTLALAGGWWMTARAIRPIDDISAAASRISAGNLSERINVTETDSELGRLAGVLNNTFARLEAAFAQQKQFTADASHELRTPIAVLIAEAQTTLARERSAAEYRETVHACLDTAQQMRRLAQSLLELARFDAGQETITRESVDLAERAQACVELIRPLANERGIVIHCDLAPALALGDPMRLGQVITNLLTNAVHYNRDLGEIRVATRHERGAAMLTVTDTGAGIAPEDLPHIFERFYRGDKSRASRNGRAGLGLAICKAIVEAHGGSIVAGSKPGQGSSFIVRLGASTTSG